MGGKFLFGGDTKLYVRGVTYGTFARGEHGAYLPSPAVVERDFGAMAANGINAVRVYTVPPRWLLDLAELHGLYVMVGLPWEQHVAFLEDRRRAAAIERAARAGVAACAGHPAVLCYAIGNEIPASIVRWHGRRRVERFLERLQRAAKEEDPEGLVTYVNFPSTEYLQLPFLDIACFNVYLEAEEQLGAYVARLQTIAGERPLLLSEIGLDSVRNGKAAQALAVAWQTRTAFGAGCAGVFVFAWTDEWHRGSWDVRDWEFGLTDRDRRPKPALEAVRAAFDDVPLRDGLRWPRISVIVCSHNGAVTLGDCLDGVRGLEYPNHEVIVVDDGSTDRTAAIAEEHGARVIRTENKGLSSARNTGFRAATGTIVAYLDDDCRPDPHWLSYLAAEFMTTPHAGIGGPNVAPPGAGKVAACIAQAPGGPTHVLVSDREAEHIPGCNMAFRKEALVAVDGFDPQFRVAGDDVDLCWRLQNAGWTLGFCHGAMVWHRPRSSMRAYLKQQFDYGKAEAVLERKWPERYNRTGHLKWPAHAYGGMRRRAIGPRRWRIYYGTWGTGLFQSVYERAPGAFASLPLMPEWYLLIALFAALSTYELAHEPLLSQMPLLDVPFTLVVLLACLGVLVFQALHSASNAFRGGAGRRSARLILRGRVALLYLLQPLARLFGRMRHGLTPWRRRGALRGTLPARWTRTIWSEDWRSTDERLTRLEADLRRSRATIVRGGDYDRWELHVRPGSLGSARLRMAVEEHGRGKQLLRFRAWPHVSSEASALLAVMVALFVVALLRDDVEASVASGALAGVIAVRTLRECGGGMTLLLRSVESHSDGAASEDMSSRPRPELPVALGEGIARARADTASADGGDRRTAERKAAVCAQREARPEGHGPR